MSFSKFFSKQARKPSGLFGRFVMSKIFDKGNANLNRFVLELMAVDKTDIILEIGFGTGLLIHQMAKKLENGFVEGIDFSSTMLSIARRNNRKYFVEGKVRLVEGNFDEMPFDSNRFDKICTVNTIYFWPDPEKTTKKIVDILKPEGKFITAFEDKEQLKRRPLSDEVFHLYSAVEVKNLFLKVGFSAGVNIQSKELGSSIYHCVVGTK
jgi:ubiquinone/menaquinone biosynthesis C-methylase UbiE